MWIVDYKDPPGATCPATMPTTGTACDECHLPTFACPYTTDQDCFGTPRGATAGCSGGQWSVSIASCNPPPPPDAGQDAAFDASAVDAGVDATSTD